MVDSETASVPKSRKKKMTDLATRKTPEGDSTKKKSVAKLQSHQPRTTKTPHLDLSNTSASTASSLKRRRDNDHEGKRILKKQKPDLSDASIQSTPSVKYSGSKKKKKIQDDSWEEAVAAARGRPDGAVEGAVDTVEKTMKTTPKKNESKSKNEFKLNQLASKTLKRLKGKATVGSKTIKLAKEEKGHQLLQMKKKERKKQRKMQNKNFDLIAKTKQIWAELSRHDCSEEKRKELCDQLYKLVKGSCKELIFTHDASRALQCLMKYGRHEHRTGLFNELKDSIVQLSKSPYAHFFVKKALKYGDKSQKNFIFKSLYGKVRRLIRHKVASNILETAYNEYANAVQRSALVEEFYGPTFALFKTNEVRTLDQIMTSEPAKKESILSNLKEALGPLADKSNVNHSIVHRLFLEYFSYANNHQRAEMIESLRENLIHMIHTRDGARVAMYCIWYGTAKDRKVIIKSMKTHVSRICKDEYGHMVLLALFDVVDDTKIVQKAILEEMCKSLKELTFNQHGRKVLLYLLVHRDPLHFMPDVVKVLQQGDNNSTSKKDPNTRRQELLSAISQPLLDLITEHSKELVMNNATLLLILAVISHATGDLTAAMEAISKIAGQPFTAGSLENFHIIEHPAGHLTMKKLILNDSTRIKEGQEVLFSNVLLRTLPRGSLKSWAACNRGCFILLILLELDKPDITSKVKKELASIQKSLDKMDFKGAQLLVSKLKQK